MAYTHLKPGVELEITARAYFESASADMSSLVQLSPETLKEREEGGADNQLQKSPGIFEGLSCFSHLEPVDGRPARTA